ncbi:hypothetical protein LAKU_17c00400 [Apilactobacillus kunkeei EFB6]|uniref:Uncharacterized protein n=1 Tax=Apilactobacillus kunkeei EFB6 TaxID=1419324 RepID=A0A836YVZ4_9LACO|nr:hypothetical protein [Apilactobacillus kunkeei]KDB00690.1 hypothetical protein LAKU_17c00400 [Apilactobacillus kunkeei EFB6]
MTKKNAKKNYTRKEISEAGKTLSNPKATKAQKHKASEILDSIKRKK